MAKSAVAQETICALRRQIARIEQVLPESFAAPSQGAGGGAVVLRRSGVAGGAFVESGAPSFDAALGGGLPKAALTEIIGGQSRDAAAIAGFALAMAARARHAGSGGTGEAGGPPLLWIGLGVMLAEAGFPYAPGLHRAFGLPASGLFFARTKQLADALWIAEEAARFGGFAAVILELQGNPSLLDLTATRRLHRRAACAGRPIFLLRQAARPEPTAAPVRLAVSPAPSALRRTLAGLMPQSIGPPAFRVAIDKSHGPPAVSFGMEWNRHDLAFQESGAEDSRTLVSAFAGRPRAAEPARAVLAFPQRRAG